MAVVEKPKPFTQREILLAMEVSNRGIAAFLAEVDDRTLETIAFIHAHSALGAIATQMLNTRQEA